MTGRIRPGIYVLGLIRLRSYGNISGHIGDMTQFFLKLGSCHRYAYRRSFSGRTALRPPRGGQSPSGFRSRR
jgi:hypothetical protein